MSSKSNSSKDELVPRKRGRPRKVPGQEKFICNACNLGFFLKTSLLSHVKKCPANKKQSKNLQCMWCGVVFVNRGNLASHAFHIHGDSSYKSIISLEDEKNNALKCDVCNQTFSKDVLLRIHIRKFHFNLKAKVPYAEIKKVNQIWFEKVLNSNKIIEIKKTAKNTLVLRKLDDNTAIKIMDSDRQTIDLSNMYPTYNMQSKKTNCKYCNKYILKRDHKKHIDEVHLKKTKHSCNNCNRSFKRVYQYLQHQCGRLHKLRGVKQAKECQEFKISSVESLQIPLTSKH